jgi:hypothetical protein
MKLIDNAREMFDVAPKRVFWCYGHKTRLHKEMSDKNYNMREGLPKDFNFVTKNSIVVLDDLMVDAKNDVGVTQLFTRGAHHIPCFVIFTQQDIFEGEKQRRTRQRNTQYMVLFKNPMDKLAIRTLEQRMFPHIKGFLVKSYEAATEAPHSYLLIDSHQQTSALVRLRARILPDERPMEAYVDKQNFGEIGCIPKDLIYPE